MEKIYTQEDLDSILEKKMENYKNKYEKTHINLESYQELESKYKNLEVSNKKNDFKETFKKHGGNLDAYDDFINVHSDVLDLQNEDLNKKINELKETKKHFFNKPTIVENHLRLPKDNEIFKDNGGDNELYAGTMYKQGK